MTLSITPPTPPATIPTLTDAVTPAAAAPAAEPTPNVSAPAPAPESTEPQEAGPTGDAPGQEEPVPADAGDTTEAEAGEPKESGPDLTDPIGQEPAAQTPADAVGALINTIDPWSSKVIGEVKADATVVIDDVKTAVDTAITDVTSASSGVVSSDTAAVVKTADSVVADVVAPAKSFLEKVEATAAEVRHEILGIKDFPQEVKDFVLQTLDNGSHQTKGLIAEVLAYVKKMGPNAPVTGATIDTNQVGFFTQLVSAIEHPGDDFRTMMQCLLAIIHQHKTTGAFAMNLYARGLHSMPLHKAQRDTFQSLINLFRTTSGGDTRKEALKQVDLNRSVEGLSQTAQERIKNFYRV